MTRIPITLTVNGETYPLEVDPQRTLLEVLRQDLALTGTKSNCLAGECGACTVIVAGRAINACLYLAVRADGQQIRTIEGLSGPDGLHPVQEAFIRHAAVQCGYCTPGFIMAAVAYLERYPEATEADLLASVAGNICRCTGYTSIRRSLRSLAAVITGS